MYRDGDFLIEVVTYTGQHLVSTSFASEQDAVDAAKELRSSTMVETVSVIATWSGEVLHCWNGRAVQVYQPT